MMETMRLLISTLWTRYCHESDRGFQLYSHNCLGKDWQDQYIAGAFRYYM